MASKLLTVALASLMCFGCTPENTEYPHLSQILNTRNDVAELGIKKIAGGMKLNGFGYTLVSDRCPGDYHVVGLRQIDFTAELDSAGKWSVVASIDLKNSLRKEDTTTAFNLIMDSLSKQCATEYERIQSWAENSLNQ